ncbi:MAG: HAD-IA family hydrolase [Dehalococcoidia bacterium]|nr:HAD-IA family hydrolase [Dehalococcoidia bacterium]
MSVRSVFLDFYNTLCAFDPSREERQAVAWKKFNIDVCVDTIRRAYVPGDRYWTLQNALRPVQQLPKEEWDSFTTEYEQYLLREAGVEVSRDLAREIYLAYSSQEKGLKLFHDIEPSLSAMKEAGLTLGIISNSDTDVAPMIHDFGVAGYFSFILSSCDVGCEKPHAPIFELALAKAAVRPEEAVHVGDQYSSDVVGARAVGITPLLLDRFSLMADQDDCQRIQGLDELLAYLGLPLWKSESLLVSAI